jgi:hypothetical protein
MEQDQKFELQKLDLQSPAKDVAGRSIGKQGLGYITLIMARASAQAWC